MKLSKEQMILQSFTDDQLILAYANLQKQVPEIPKLKLKEADKLELLEEFNCSIANVQREINKRKL